MWLALGAASPSLFQNPLPAGHRRVFLSLGEGGGAECWKEDGFPALSYCWLAG